MKLFKKNPTRVLGVPMGLKGLTSYEARLSQFEPENPKLLIPRNVGIGWDVNFGTVAVRLGLIRPDDSLPDLEKYIPESTRTALTVAPLAGAVAVAGMGAAVAVNFDEIPSKYDVFFRPKAWKPAGKAVLSSVLVPAGFAVWNLINQQREQRVDVISSGLACSMEALAALTLAAGVADAKGQRGAASALAAGSLGSAFAVMMASTVGTVKSALKNLDKQLGAR